MTLIVDYSFSRPSPSVIKAAGYSGVMRYLSADSGKNLSKPEATALLGAGLSIGLVWETTAMRASQGRAAGASDAAAAEAQANALGYPSTAVIFYAVDYDAMPTAVAAYFAGVVSMAHRPVGVYGSKRVVEGTSVPYKWQACAWSGGLVSPGAHLYQRLRATVAHPISGTDENIILHDFPMWTNAPAVPVHTAPVAPSRSKPRSPLPASPVRGPFPLPFNAGYGIGQHTGAVGNESYGVREIQMLLKSDIAPGIAVDGSYGPTTAKWVGYWTKRFGPYPTSVVNAQVWDHMAAYKGK